MGNSIGWTRGRIRSICFPRSTRASSAAGCTPATSSIGVPSWPPLRASCPSRARLRRRARSLTHASRRELPDIVLSRTLDNVAWKNTRIVRDIEEIRGMKQQPGKDMHAVGGATLVGSLLNQGLIDELRLVVQPIVLGGGKALFKDVKERHGIEVSRRQAVGVGLGPSDLSHVTCLRDGWAGKTRRTKRCSRRRPRC